MQQREAHFSTPEQVRDYLSTTLAIIAGGDVPEDLRVATFAAVFAAVSGKQVFFEQPQMIPDLAGLRRDH